MKQIIIIICLSLFSSLYSQKISKKDIKRFTKLIERQDTVKASEFLLEHTELTNNEIINKYFSLYEYPNLKNMLQENEVLRDDIWKYIYKEHKTEVSKEYIDELNWLYKSYSICHDDIISIVSELNYADCSYGELNRMSELEIFSDNNILKKKIESAQSEKIKSILNNDIVKTAQTILNEEDTTIIPLIMEDIILPQLQVFTLQELASILPSFQESIYYEDILFEFENKLEDLLSSPCDELISSISSKLEDLIPKIKNSLKTDMTNLYDEFLGGTLGVNSLKNNLFKSKENTNKTFMNIWQKHNKQQYYSRILNKEITSELQNFITNRNTFLKYFIDKEFKSTISDSVITIKLKPNFKVMRNTVEENFSSVACDFGMNIGGIAATCLFPPANPFFFGFQLGWNIGDTINEKEYFINNQTDYLYAQIAMEINSYFNEIQNILQKENAEIISLIINKQ